MDFNICMELLAEDNCSLTLEDIKRDIAVSFMRRYSMTGPWYEMLNPPQRPKPLILERSDSGYISSRRSLLHGHAWAAFRQAHPELNLPASIDFISRDRRGN